jgi:hypothetical protein
MPLKVWQDLAHQDRVQPVQVLDQKVANLDQVDQDLVVQVVHAQDLVPQNREWVAQVHLVVSPVVLQLAEEVAVLAAVQLVLLVKVAQEANLRPESQSARRGKNLNKEVSQVLVEQLSQEEMAQQ